MTWNGGQSTVRVGSVVVTVTASATGTPAPVTFTPPFAGSPIVSTQVIGNSVYNAYPTATPITTGMSVSVRHVDNTAATTTVTVHWIAREP